MSAFSVEEPACFETGAEDPIELIVEARPRAVGTLTVARVLPTVKRRSLGPFVFLDHMGPVVIPPGEGFDVKPHPHIGLSTVTYFFEGEAVHRDSIGSVQTIRAGDVNVMTAGRGVVHSERSGSEWRAHGGALHGVQIWVALRSEREEDAPTFEHHGAATFPPVTPAAGTRGRVLMGSAFGTTSPISHSSEPLLVELELEPGACVDIPVDVPERAVFVVAGGVGIGNEVGSVNRMVVLRANAPARVRASVASRLMFLGGTPAGQRFIDWNFVSSSKARIEDARRAWKAQTFPKIPGDDKEFVPLPDLPRRA